MNVKEMRKMLFAIDNENLTVKEMRGILFAELNQRLKVTGDLFNDELSYPADDYDWADGHPMDFGDS